MTKQVMTIDYEQALALVKKKDKITPEQYSKEFWKLWKTKRKERIEK
jgi:hypothetical protein